MSKTFLFAFAALLIPICSLAQANQPLSNFDVIQYTNSISVNDNTDTINFSSAVLLRFLKNTDTIALDFKNADDKGRGMFVSNVSINGVKNNNILHKNNLLQIAHPGKAGDTSRILINYFGVPQNGLIVGQNKFMDKTWFGDNWPDRARYWLPCVDHPGDKAKFEWIVHAPSQYSVTANGLLLSEISLNRGTIKKWVFYEKNPIPVKVAVIGIAKFDKTCAYNSCVPVCNYYYPQTYGRGNTKMEIAKDVLAFFDSTIAPYPFQKLNNVQSTTMFGGMENAGNIFYDENAIDDNSSAEALIAHEIAHQWFGNTVTEKDFSHIWLSEGFATFFTHYYIEKKYGIDSFNKRIETDIKRVKRFLLNNKRPVIDSTKNLMSLLNANSYQKGGLFLEALRKKLGEEIFMKIIREFYKKYQYANANTEDFRNIAEAISGKDLKPFFAAWLYSCELPD